MEKSVLILGPKLVSGLKLRSSSTSRVSESVLYLSLWPFSVFGMGDTSHWLIRQGIGPSKLH